VRPDVALRARAEVHELDPVGIELVRGEHRERERDEERRGGREARAAGTSLSTSPSKPRRIGKRRASACAAAFA